VSRPHIRANSFGKVHHSLTFEQFASYQFDPNAESLYALGLLPQLGE
jgi:hypothetical protein